jgi:hypothetical protein
VFTNTHDARYTDLCEQNGGWGEKSLYARHSWLIRWFHGYLDVQVRLCWLA